MKAAIVTTIGVLALTLTLTASAFAAPHGDQTQCPNGPPAVQAQRSATGNANACGPRT